MSSKKSFVWTKQRPVISRPPAHILHSVSPNISMDRSLLTDEFYSMNTSYISSESHNSYRSIKHEPLEGYENQLATKDDCISVSKYSTTCSATFKDEDIFTAPYIYPNHCFSGPQYSKSDRDSIQERDVVSLRSPFPFLDRDQVLAGNNLPSAINNVAAAISGVITPLQSPLSVTRRSAAYESRFAGNSLCKPFGRESHSEGYSTCSSSRSWTSSGSPGDYLSTEPTTYCHQLLNRGKIRDKGSSPSPVDPLPLPLPPAQYKDDDEEAAFTPCDLSLTQRSSGAVSDFFSQSGSSCSSVSLCYDRLRQEDGFENSRKSNVDGDSDEISAPHSTASSLEIEEEALTPPLEGCATSTVRSPETKRGRFDSCKSDKHCPDEGQVQNEQYILDYGRYSNEYAKDTYFWLCHQEATIHATGLCFMAAQKVGGASEEDRRTAVTRAVTEMRKLKHTESIHLGVYIMDKCLDSFHIASGALADVCAVSMVLGTKMEEYDSLRPGNVDGLAGASRNKARLCQIEKRIIHELNDGLCFPTPLIFANYMLAYINSDEEQIRFTHYLLELALLESQFRDEGGARVAHAAVCISTAMVKKKDSMFASECQALLDVEHRLFDLTKITIGSTRSVMRKLALEMGRAVDEKHPLLIDYLADDNKRICFCEVSPALWNFFCSEYVDFYESPELDIYV